MAWVTAARHRAMQDFALPIPPLILVRVALAAVWLYEGLWCKLLGGEQHQVSVVEAVPKLGPRIGKTFLKALGIVEVAIATWILSGWMPAACALVQTALLVGLNINGILWARHVIHDPAGMVVKNVSFLLLAWLSAALVGHRP